MYSASNRQTTKHATDLVWLYSNLRLAKRTQSLEQQGKAQPWVVLSGEEEEKEEGSSSWWDSSDEDKSRSAIYDTWISFVISFVISLVISFVIEAKMLDNRTGERP